MAEPARPLFIGRKSCLPSTPILAGQVKADTLHEALMHFIHKALPQDIKSPPSGNMRACWPPGQGPEDPNNTTLDPWYDRRDWQNQIHCGQRMVRIGMLRLPQEGKHG
ncbi:MAG: hypothetical protein HQL62_09240 [Magnetococcales bacterium]|nr:hypothetical protein [Magnetococcales bacterium]